MLRLAGGLVFSLCSLVPCKAESVHNVVLFIADGLRPSMIDEKTAPNLNRLLNEGVRFTNTHSMFPSFTTANASALATGHLLGDTGDFSNTVYAGFKVKAAKDSLTPFIENDDVLAELDQHFDGDYLHQQTIVNAAQNAGINTAVIGKLGPTMIFDHQNRSQSGTIMIDDMMGKPAGIKISAEIQKKIADAGLPPLPPSRDVNANSGNFKTPGTLEPNKAQQDYFTDIANKVVLPFFKEQDKRFYLVFWSRDPDGTQHAQGDSLNKLVPGINGPTSLAAIKNADDDLGRLLDTLRNLGLDKMTDVIVTSDHGFSTISKESKTSFAAKQTYQDTLPGLLPQGFVAIDLAQALALPLLDPDDEYKPMVPNTHTKRGNGIIGGTADDPKIILAANGGSDLIYMPQPDKQLVAQIVKILAKQDYVSGMFVADELGPVAGTLPLSAIALKGSAVMPSPAIVVNFRSFSTGCENPLRCGVSVADTGLQQGQGMHGSFSRADTMTLGGAIGPDFLKLTENKAPTSNADIGVTIAHILGVKPVDNGKLTGRILTEAMVGEKAKKWIKTIERSQPDETGLRTILVTQTIGKEQYFDTGGYAGQTLGINGDLDLTKTVEGSEKPQ